VQYYYAWVLLRLLQGAFCVVCDVGVTKLRHFVRGACVNLVHFAGLLHCTGGGGGGEAQKSVIFVLICVMTKICLSMGMIVTFVGALDVVADVINNNFDSSTIFPTAANIWLRPR
jgi:hypothetical protein